MRYSIVLLSGLATCLLDAMAGSPGIESLSANRMGDGKATVNARVLTDGTPGTYWVEYGDNQTYGRSTAPRPLPPLHSAYLAESWMSSSAGWAGGLSGKDLRHEKDDSGAGYISYAGPTEKVNTAFPGNPPGCDVNHVDGVGTLHLCTYAYVANMGKPPTPERPVVKLNLGGGYPDLRDAIIKMDIRGRDYVGAGSELVFWAQADNDRSLQETESWKRANWAYTGQSLSRYLRSGKWEQVVVSLDNDANKWSYAGNNHSQERYDRYAYNSLDASLSDVNCNIFFLQTSVDPSHPPSGKIDFKDLTILYRNHSLLYPAHGTQLIASPKDSVSPASTLTDGWRNGADRMWQSAAAPVYPQEFIWKFKNRVELQTLQLHQHSDFPTREVATFGSDDGEHWTVLFRGELPAGSKISANHSYSLIELGQIGCRYFKLQILSGYKPEACGLGEVELFGRGLELATDAGWNHLNTDIDIPQRGGSWHYRFAVKTGDTVSYGPDCVLALLPDNRPLIENARIENDANGIAIGKARVTPLGAKTTVVIETRRGSDWQRCSEPMYAGRQNTPRDVVVPIQSPRTGDKAEFRIVATNEHGSTSEVIRIHD